MGRQRKRKRPHSAEAFILACIRLYPWHTGEDIVRRVMAVAPTMWSKATLITVLSRLRSNKHVVTKLWERRAGKDQKTLVYALTEDAPSSNDQVHMKGPNSQ